ncbi:hypothetical protein FGO68_gene12219 [Halteria grandinella]|uniref:Uncharacterized protein n=1 Tax=Halteria grandinella TaxID=5974 RepID=A0A8J8SXG2_HALGN|nr:hypothetical protein FGO68_gene12219 [Halteria grandinella]
MLLLSGLTISSGNNLTLSSGGASASESSTATSLRGILAGNTVEASAVDFSGSLGDVDLLLLLLSCGLGLGSFLGGGLLDLGIGGCVLVIIGEGSEHSLSGCHYSYSKRFQIIYSGNQSILIRLIFITVLERIIITVYKQPRTLQLFKFCNIIIPSLPSLDHHQNYNNLKNSATYPSPLNLTNIQAVSNVFPHQDRQLQVLQEPGHRILRESEALQSHLMRSLATRSQSRYSTRRRSSNREFSKRSRERSKYSDSSTILTSSSTTNSLTPLLIYSWSLSSHLVENYSTQYQGGKGFPRKRHVSFSSRYSQASNTPMRTKSHTEI